MTWHPMTPDEARTLADQASEAIRALNHATLAADGYPALRSPADAYQLLGALSQMAGRIPQLLAQISAFLQRQLQLDVVSVDGGDFSGDQLAAIGTASHALNQAARAACGLAAAIDTAQQAIAFVSSVDARDERA
jgi:hypothetical protein